MSGRHVQLGEEMQSRFERLWQFLGGYLHQDWPELHATPEGAVADAIADYPLEMLEEVHRQLQSVLAETPDDTRLRSVLNGGFGVNVYFHRPAEARAFADSTLNQVHAAITERSRKAHPARGRRP